MIVSVVTTATAAQTLPQKVARVNSVIGVTGGASVAATSYTVVTGAPGAGDVQFSGTPQNPSDTLTFNAAQVAAGVLLVDVDVPGDIPANI